MAIEDLFEPRLGKMRSLGSKRGHKYLHQVLAAANLAGRGAAKRGDFHGNRIGRGAGVGRVLVSRDRFGAYRHRRVIIKSRIVKLAGKAAGGARAHLRYIQRDGVTREGQPGELYGAEQERVDGKAFLERGEGDRHQFRFIVSPEDGAEYDELKPLTRRLMAQVEEDLGTKLDWVAVDHFNTGHPHTHIMLRGKDENGRDLILARDYIGTGMRERAAEIVQLDLGPRTDIEIERRLLREVEQERLTSLDRSLIRNVGGTGLVTAADRDPFRQTLLTGRLRKLEHLGLAEQAEPGRWQLAQGLEEALTRMGERGDIIKTMHREMTGRGMSLGASELAVFDPAAAEQRPIVGRLVSRGLSDELADRHYLIVDGVDGRTHYVDIGKGEAVAPMPQHAIVRVEARKHEVRQVDRTIVEVSAANAGRYDVDLHLRHDPSSSSAFAEAHVRRLEAMRRATGSVERSADGTWTIAFDHLKRVAAFEQRELRDRPVEVQMLSVVPLEQQLDAHGATWIDRQLVSATPELLRDSGFGREVRSGQAQRRQWLLAQGFAEQVSEQTIYRAEMLAALQGRELQRVAGQLSRELGLAYAETRPGERIKGLLKRPVDLVSGRFALVEKSKEFTLVPWRPALEQQVGKQVAGILRDGGVSWTIGRQRSEPSI